MSIYDQYLLQASRDHILDSPNQLINVFNKLTKDLCKFLNAGRVSIWFYKNNNQTINCISSYSDHHIPFKNNLELHHNDYTPYFKALEEERIIKAQDASTHHATSCFTESYLSKYGIKSMFDTPIWKSDQVVGVLCLEYFETKSGWSTEETNFIISFSDFLGKIYERNETLKLIENLENKVQQRTYELSEAVAHLKRTQDFMVQQEKLASLGTIVAGVAHELRNPLNHIIASSNIISEHIQDNQYDKDTTNKLIKIIKSSALRANNIIKNMLNQVIENDEIEAIHLIEFIKQNFNLAKFNHRVVGNVSIKLEIESLQEEIIVYLSKQKITQVFLNLFENSFYSMSEKSLSISNFTGIIKIHLMVENNNIKLTIRDNGNGIPKEKMNRIFEPFYTTKKVGDGTGLGLAIVYDIIKAHHGTISVDSSEDHFTEFTIILPQNSKETQID